MTRIAGSEDVCTFMISHQSLLRMRNVSNKSCKESQNTRFMFNNSIYDSCAIYEVMWKSVESRAGHRQQCNTVHVLFVLDN